MSPHFEYRLARSCYALRKAHPSREFFVEDYAIFTPPKVQVQTLAQVDDFDDGLYLDANGDFRFTSTAQAEARRIHDLLAGD